ncbi:MAG: amidohydrolase family protein, partial [Dehalococcoidia bacterium]|nr:amidohydrolase family protein [Dehalococcoidia bacterium]
LATSSPRDQAWLTNMQNKVMVSPKMWGVEERLADMDRAGVDMQVLTVSAPNAYFDDRETSKALAQSTNEVLAGLCKKYPQRFKALASVPMLNTEDAIAELRRAIHQLGMHGVILGSNIRGRPLNSPEFLPFYEEADKMGLAIFIHPMSPMGSESLNEYDLVATVGFLMETTVAATRMVYSGIFEQCQNLRLILPHLGGVIPYIISRIDDSHRTRPECRLHISKPPSNYLKQFYLDTVCFHLPALQCGLDTFGSDKMVLGSDYPFALGSIDKSVECIKALGLSAEEEEKVFSGNLAKLLK